MITARARLCRVPQPFGDRRNPGRSRRSLRLAFAVGCMMGVQAVTAGPAAVATLPSALLEKRSALPEQPVVTASVAFTPKLAKDPGLFKAILDGAFSRGKSKPAKPAPQTAEDVT